MSVAFFSLLGIAVGATLQYLFSRYLEERKHTRLLQTQAYANYLRAVSDARHLSLTVREEDVLTRLADAKTRICLYGSKRVVALLADFERHGSVIGNEEQRSAFVALITAMRGDSKVENAELEINLLGPDEERPVRKRLRR